MEEKEKQQRAALKDQTEIYLRLIYFEFKYIQFEKNILQYFFRHFPIFIPPKTIAYIYKSQALLIEIKHFCDEVRGEIDRPELRIVFLEETNESLNKHLGDLYKIRSQLSENLADSFAIAKVCLQEEQSLYLPFERELQDMEVQVARIDSHMDQIIIAINKEDDVAREAKEVFEELLRSVSAQIKTIFRPYIEKYAEFTTRQYRAIPHNLKQSPYGLERLSTLKATALLINQCANAVQVDIQPLNLFYFLEEYLKQQYILPILDQYSQALKCYLDELIQPGIQRIRAILGNGKLYLRIFRQFEILIFWRSWNGILTKEHEKLMVKRPKMGQLDYALEVKRLLLSVKKYFWVRFFKEDHFEHITKLIKFDQYLTGKNITHITHITQQIQLERNLNEDYRTIRREVSFKEKQLQSYSWGVGILSSVMRLWTESFYCKWSETSMDIFEEIIQNSALKDHPILGVQLGQSYLTFIKHFEGSILLGIDLFTSRWTGMSFTMLNSLSGVLTSDLDSILQVGNKLLADEKSISDHHAKLQWLAGLGLHLGIYTSLFGMTQVALVFFGGSYLLGTASRALAELVIDRVQGRDKSNTTDRNITDHQFTQSFARGMVGHLTYMTSTCLWRSAFQRFHPIFSRKLSPPSDDQLLKNSAMCLAERERCKQVVLKRLDLPWQASPEEIKERTRQLALEFHPDKSHAATEDAFIDYREAVERLRELSSPDRRTLKFGV